MYIRMLNFQTVGHKKAQAQSIMDTMIPFIRSLRGCKDCIFIMHDLDDSYALLVFWETEEDADAAAGLIGPKMLPSLNKISREAINPVLYEVYEPAMQKA
jgi:hypothetical protein